MSYRHKDWHVICFVCEIPSRTYHFDVKAVTSFSKEWRKKHGVVCPAQQHVLEKWCFILLVMATSIAWRFFCKWLASICKYFWVELDPTVITNVHCPKTEFIMFTLKTMVSSSTKPVFLVVMETIEVTTTYRLQQWPESDWFSVVNVKLKSRNKQWWTSAEFSSQQVRETLKIFSRLLHQSFPKIMEVLGDLHRFYTDLCALLFVFHASLHKFLEIDR